MQLSIKGKMIFTSVILVLIIIFISITAFISITSISNKFESVVGTNFPNYGNVRDATVDIHQAVIAELQLLYSIPNSQDFKDSLKTYTKNIKQSEERLNKIDIKTLTIDNQKKIDEYKKIRKKWLSLSENVIKLATDITKREEAIIFLNDEVYPVFDEMEEALDAVGDGISTKMTELKDREIEQQNSNKRSFLILSIIGLCISIVIGFILIKSIIKDLKHIIKKVNFVGEGEGDLTSKIDIIGKDEIGQLAAGFNLFIDKVHKIVVGAKEQSTYLLQIKNSLSAVTEETAASLHEISANIKGVSDQIILLSSNILESVNTINDLNLKISVLEDFINKETYAVTESTAATDQITASLENVEQITKAKKIVSDNLIQTSNTGGDKLKATTEYIENINQTIENISEMVGIINGIANSTNLLAMNAAIEAAHAGDSGKGFSVVADEIRKLAESSSENAKRISIVIKGVTENISKASTSGIEADTAFKEINREVEDVSLAFAEITSSTAELTTGSKEIQSSMNILSDISINVKDAANQMHIFIEKVINSISIVERISQEVNGSVGEITEGTLQISKAMDEVNDLTVNMGNAAENLDNEIKNFKTE